MGEQQSTHLTIRSHSLSYRGKEVKVKFTLATPQRHIVRLEQKTPLLSDIRSNSKNVSYEKGLVNCQAVLDISTHQTCNHHCQSVPMVHRLRFTAY
jgi:hypothetical protein